MARGTIEELTTHSDMSEGELLALSYLFPQLGQLKTPILVSLLGQLCKIICSSTHPNEKRLLASNLAVECALKLEPECSKTVLDSLKQFLESGQTVPMREKVYRIAGKLLPKAGEKHALFKAMTLQAKKFLKSKDPSKRTQSLLIFRIFAKSLVKDEFMHYLFGFLADSDKEVK
jgi:hypothetical protein